MPTSTSTATYVYCVVKSKKAPSLARAPKGLAGASRPRLIDAGGGFRIVVAAAPLTRYAAERIDERLRDIDWVAARAAEHEAIVEHAASHGTVVPMKLFTLFSSDERALAHVTKMKRTLARVAERIDGCDEWGLRILYDEAEAARAAEAQARATRSSSGTGFLQRKSQLQTARRTTTARASDEVDTLYSQLAKLARRSVRRSAPSRELAGRVMLDAVFLVPRRSTKRMKMVVGATAEGLATRGFRVTLSGPWPAYNFIGAR